MANNRISITAEFVSIIKSESDPMNSYFVSDRAKRYYNFARLFLSEKRMREMFRSRIKLSEAFDKKINDSGCSQIIELAAGYSLRGFRNCLHNQDIIYIDSDLPEVVSRKKDILRLICKKEGLIFPDNYHLVAIDVLKEDIHENVSDFLGSHNKTLIIAEALTSYFTDREFQLFIDNVSKSLKGFDDAEFCSNINVSRPAGLLYKMFRSAVSLITNTGKSKYFSDPEHFRKYLYGFGKFDPEFTGNEEVILYSLKSSRN